MARACRVEHRGKLPIGRRAGHGHNRRVRTSLATLGAALVLVGAGAARPAEEPVGQLAYASGPAASSDVHLIAAGASGRRRLTRDGRSTDPAWSPDGRRLAYVSFAGGDGEILVSDARGRHVRRLTRNRVEDVLPSWSPDGRRIAFASDRSGAFEIYVLDVQGGEVDRVTRFASEQYGAFYPAWSPDGRWIAFASAARSPENQEIYVVRPDGTGLTRLTRTAGTSERLGDDSTPSWSPDGRSILFASHRSGNLDVWIMRADGRRQRRLTGLPRNADDRPRMSPDGRWVAFTSLDPRGRSAVHLARRDGSGIRRLVAGAAPSWRP